jgi:hypothetical protein
MELFFGFGGGMVEDLIRQARRRFIVNQAFAQTALALAVVAGGFALLLILGTALLAWWSLTIFAAAGAGVGIYRLNRRMPDSYRTAVRLDESAHLPDTLSTAYHFSTNAPVHGAEFLKLQREQAESVARGVSLTSAIPFTIPRSFYAMAALAVLATGLVGLRYSTGKGLDLQRPITEVLFNEDPNSAQPKQLAKNTRPGPNEWSEQAQDLLAKLGIKPDLADPEGEPDAFDKALEQALKQQQQNAQSQNQNGGNDPKNAQQGKDGANDDAAGGEPIDGGDKKSGDPKDSNSEAQSNGGDASNKNGKGKDGDSKDNNLMSKLRDAVSSMLSKSPSKPSETKPGDKSQKSSGEKKDGSSKADPGQGTPETSNSNDENADSDPNGDALGGQKGSSNDTTASNTPQKQEGSGVGLADGSKDVKAAEQLKAMGKISEIIGKRSQTVSGETMVEVQSGKQQLRTDYTKSTATHAETDGDVTRDEIPLALQPYVQQYFAEVHRADSAAADAKKKPAK